MLTATLNPMATSKYVPHGERLGRALTARRIELDLSQTEVSKRSGLARPTQVGWEAGRIPHFTAQRPRETRDAYERVLEWEEGTIVRILAEFEEEARAVQQMNAGAELLKSAVTDEDWESDTLRMRRVTDGLLAHLRAMSAGMSQLEEELTTAPQRAAFDLTQRHLSKLTLELLLSSTTPGNQVTQSAAQELPEQSESRGSPPDED